MAGGARWLSTGHRHTAVRASVAAVALAATVGGQVLLTEHAGQVSARAGLARDALTAALAAGPGATNEAVVGQLADDAAQLDRDERVADDQVDGGLAVGGLLLLAIAGGLTVAEVGERRRRRTPAAPTAGTAQDRAGALSAHVREVVLVVKRNPGDISLDLDVIDYASPAALTVLGCPPGDLVGTRLSSLGQANRAAWSGALRQAIGGEPVSATLPVTLAGRTFAAEAVLTDLTGDPAVGGLAVTLRDGRSPGRRRADDPGVDDLTGLPNRRRLQQRLEELLAEPDSAPRAALLLLDLDCFAEVNETLGHSAGDRLIRQAAERLAAVAPAHALCARFAGDSFAVALDAVADPAAALEVATALRSCLQAPFHVDDLPVVVDASVGVVVAEPPVDGLSVATQVAALLRRADVALSLAKQKGTGTALYDSDADSHSRERLTVLGELRSALDRNEVVLHYQPTYDLASGDLHGVEALVRWEHPTRGLLAPADFIPVAERSGLIRPLTTRTLELAVTQAATWARNGHRIPVAVNLSARLLHDVRLPDRVASLLTRHRLDASLLRLEITETSLMADPEQALEVLEGLHHLGIGLSVDDFGTGYSSLSMLRRLPVDEIKVDRSFVAELAPADGGGTGDRVLVRSIVRLGHDLGMKVVAEGVEDRPGLTALIELGCDVVQGFLVGRPMPALAFEGWLRGGGDRLDTAHAVVLDMPGQRAPAATSAPVPTQPS